MNEHKLDPYPERLSADQGVRSSAGVTSSHRARLIRSTNTGLSAPFAASSSFEGDGLSSTVDSSAASGTVGLGASRLKASEQRKCAQSIGGAGARRAPLVINRKTLRQGSQDQLDKRESGRVFADRVKAVHKRFNPGTRWATCGNPMASRVGVGRAVNGRVSASGIETCGSSASCVSCGVKVRAQRCQEIETGVKAHLASGGTAIFYTVTIPHTVSDSLEDAWKILTDSWSRVVCGGSWRRFKDKYCMNGFIKAVELTIGSKGPHIHIHCILLFDLETGAYEKEWLEIAKFLHHQWKQSVLRTSGRVISDNAGVDIRACRDERGLGEYVSKIGAEMALTSSKEGKQGNRTPWQVVHDFIETGDKQDLAVWLEWCRVSKGRQLMVWSKGLKQALGVIDESDEAIAGKDDPTRQVEGFVCSKTWFRLGQRIDGVRARFMHIWEQDGPIVAGNYLAKVMPDQFGLSMTSEGLPFIRALKKQTPTSSKPVSVS